MTATRPPLPVPAIEASGEFAELGGTFGALFTLHQLRAYGEACAAAEREACAALLDSVAADYERAHSIFEQNAADYCAGAIRARKDSHD